MKKIIREYIASEIFSDIDQSEIKFTDNLIEKGIDSIKILKLITFLEDEFEIVIPDVEVDPGQIETVNQIEKLVMKYKK